MGRYTFEEKAEYWALIWGTVIMGITGFMMWNPITTARFLPGEIIPASKAAHGGEALLAVLAILIWHMYGVHIKKFNKAMFTGKQSEAEMLHEHPLELADIKAGITSRVISPALLRRRRIIFTSVASILTIAMLVAVYSFVWGERTVIAGSLQESNQLPVYVPQTPTPFPTINPIISKGDSSLSWDSTISTLLGTKCLLCHNASNPSNGLVLSDYDSAIRGGISGGAIIPGSALTSKLIKIQSAGGHPGQLLPDEIDLVTRWIDQGAPEK